MTYSFSMIGAMSETAMAKSPFYSFSRILWSIYFVLGIAVIGAIFAYMVTLSLFIVAFLLFPFPRLSEKVRHLAEYVQCLSIRFLLSIQPWLNCETNLPPITGFYDHFGQTRKILFVANHRSNLDTFLLISFIPGLRGLAKRSLFYNFFFGIFMLIAGFIPVDKGSPESFLLGLNALRDKLLRKNRPVLIFPENTRCEKGYQSVRKMSAAVFGIAIESQALVVPLVIENTDRLMGRGDFLLNPFEPVKITMLPAIEASRYVNSKILRDDVWNLIQAGIS
jgi:1-acyl-sn-glycerol-3-phosphate acyltransferase